MTDSQSYHHRYTARLLVDDPIQSGHAVAINDSGQVAVTVDLEPRRFEITRAYVWSRGVLEDLGTLNSRNNWLSSSARAINERGDVTGNSTVDNSPRTRAVVWRDGVIMDLGTLPGYQFSQANGINDASIVVGVAYNHYGRDNQAFIWENGQMRALGHLGGGTSTAFAINSRNQVVGYSAISPGLMRGFLWEEGRMIDLGTLGGPGSRAFAINDFGSIAGMADIPSEGAGAASRQYWHPCLWHGTTGLHDLMDADAGCAKAVNDGGTVVIEQQGEAFVWLDGILAKLVVGIGLAEPWKPMFAEGINRSNQIAGSGRLNNNVVPVIFDPIIE